MTWTVDQPCEVRVSGRWVAAVVHEVDGDGVPRARVMGSGKLMRCSSEKIRELRARASVARPVIDQETGDIRAAVRGLPTDGTTLTVNRRGQPVAFISRGTEYVAQPKPSTPRSARFLEHLRRRPCDHCGAPPRSDPAHFGPHGIGLKASDFSACSLCRDDHEHWHRHGCLPGLDHERSLLVQARGACLALIDWLTADVAHEALSAAAVAHPPTGSSRGVTARHSGGSR